jgi:hypothetical protein
VVAHSLCGARGRASLCVDGFTEVTEVKGGGGIEEEREDWRSHVLIVVQNSVRGVIDECAGEVSAH